MKKCIICNKTIDHYEPLASKYIEMPKKYGRLEESISETLNKDEYSCPNCYGSDRDRLCVLFIEKLLLAAENKVINILDIAPSGSIKKYIYHKAGKGVEYFTADLFMEDVDYSVDIQDMRELKDESFQLVICCHVLEHVKDDKQALREIYRIMDKTGLAIILVPLDLRQKGTDEEWGLSKEENWRRFGQGDHVRKYDKRDFVQRLKERGFLVHELGKEYFGEEKYNENALTETSMLYVVSKDIYWNQIKDNAGLVNYWACNREEYNAENQLLTPLNHWIDCFKEEKETIILWGWAYFSEKDSKLTKAKLVFTNLATDEEKIITTDMRKRDDIQELFAPKGEFNYLFSGLDFVFLIRELVKGDYKVELLLKNQRNSHTIILSENFEVKE